MPTFTQDEIRTAAVGEEVGHGCIAVDKDTLKSKRTFLFHTQRIDLRTFKDSAGNIWRKTANTHITGWSSWDGGAGWWECKDVNFGLKIPNESFQSFQPMVQGPKIQGME
ncbi:MAG TPA: hypothetical protein VI911_09845 [Patescibacteria group bacterium]|nr:hypothetical protein [Patescibacteria group bacterium]